MDAIIPVLILELNCMSYKHGSSVAVFWSHVICYSVKYDCD